MKKRIILLILASFIISGLYAQMTVNGTLDTSVSFTAGAGNSEPFSFGIEEFANIRFQSRLRDNAAVVYGAFNLIAAAGDYAANALMLSTVPSPMTLSPYIAGENYIAGIELERLYFRLNFDKANIDGGLFRLPFGYSSVWGSSDFLNPKNPLKPDARPRGVLGTAMSFFPAGDLKLSAFAVNGRNPFLFDGAGFLFGISMENHWNKASIQALYSYETPDTGSKYGIHRAGFSLKADIEIGLIIDALYTYNHEDQAGWDGLSLSAGIDYSFFGGKLIVTAEYLYNGDKSSTALSSGFSNNNYLFTGFTWLINDFTNANLALISSLDDISFTSMITFSHDLFQGASLTVTATVPLDRDLFSNDGNRGELGPIPPDHLQPLLPERYGRYFNISARLRLRF